MIISHSHKFIFCRVPKAASSSVLYAFERSPGVHIGRRPLLSTTPNGFCHNHFPFSEIELLVNPNQYKNYFKFGFTRNPWAKMASAYTYGKVYAKTNGSMDIAMCGDFSQFLSKIMPGFPDYIRRLKTDPRSRISKIKSWVLNKPMFTLNELNKTGISPKHSMPQCDFLKGADFIGKSENAQRNFNHVCDKLGIGRMRLKHTNKSHHPHYRKMYDEETRQIIARHFASDIKKFNYQF